MLIEELMELPLEKIEAMTDDELREHFKQYFPATRPELIQTKQPKRNLPPPPMNEKERKLREMLASNGVDVGSMLKRRR